MSLRTEARVRQRISLSRLNLPSPEGLEALRRIPRSEARGAALSKVCNEMLARHTPYVREHFEDMPEIRDWLWTEARSMAETVRVLSEVRGRLARGAR